MLPAYVKTSLVFFFLPLGRKDSKPSQSIWAHTPHHLSDTDIEWVGLQLALSDCSVREENQGCSIAQQTAPTVARRITPRPGHTHQRLSSATAYPVITVWQCSEGEGRLLTDASTTDNAYLSYSAAVLSCTFAQM